MYKFHIIKKASCCGIRSCHLCLLLNTGFLLILGVFFLLGFRPIFDLILQDKMTIKPGSPTFEAFKKPTLPTIQRFYLFSVKNPKEVENGEKPALEEIGPFTYRLQMDRVNVVFNSNGTLSYETKKTWHYLPPPLSLPLTTKICTVDIPVLATAEYSRGSYFMENANYLVFSLRSGLFVNRTARELLFEGYRDPLLTVGSIFRRSKIRMDRFSWFYKMNGTTWSDEVVTMVTGTKNFSEVGDIKLWKGRNRTMYPSHCGHLKGTSSGFTAYTKENRQFIEYFSTDICKPIRFDRAEEAEVLGIKGRRFSLNATNTFGNAETNPANWCFNANLPSGVHNSTGCRGGDTTLKTFVSLPHFLDADPFFIQQFAEGSMTPDRIRHSSSMTLHMETAIPLEVLLRLQIIIQLRPNPNIGTFFEKVPNIFLPVFWFSADTVIDEEMASQLGLLTMMPGLAILFGILFLVGSFLILLLFIIRQKREVSESPPPKGRTDWNILSWCRGRGKVNPSHLGVTHDGPKKHDHCFPKPSVIGDVLCPAETKDRENESQHLDLEGDSEKGDGEKSDSNPGKDLVDGGGSDVATDESLVDGGGSDEANDETLVDDGDHENRSDKEKEDIESMEEKEFRQE